MEDPSVSNFREYLRINTVQPKPDYAACVEWLQKQAEDIGAEIQITECVPGKPIVVLTIKGQDPSLPSILLNSHTDVVPVFPEYWKYDPFSAHKEENGDIYARGSQDMKCVGVQYMEAMKCLKKDGVKLKRTVHMSFVPDEEIGGIDGVAKYVKTEEFKNLNVGFSLDEGYANTSDEMFLFYGERVSWRCKVNCPGMPGHGSQFLPNNAGKKLQKVINFFMDFRDQEEERLKNNPNLCLGDVTSVNLTMIEGGVQANVVPANLSATFDCRLAPTADIKAFEQMLDTWCKEAGEDVSITYVVKTMIQESSCVEDGRSIWWDSFYAACNQENIKLKKEIFPAGTDGKYLREIGIPVFGFSPMNKTPLLLHDHNEFLNENIFLRGIQIYKTIITHVANA